MRKYLIAGNWKMNQNMAQTSAYFAELGQHLSAVPSGVKVLLCTPYTSLSVAVEGAKSVTGLSIGAQNVHEKDTGAYTGEISAAMLKELGIGYAIIGHSERRQYYNESDESVNAKTIKSLETGLTPVVCVGELLEERKAGKQFDVVKAQLHGALANIKADDVSKIVIAYEPVWAIGTGETATPEQAQDIHAFIRSELKAAYGEKIATEVYILYGGSMNPKNAAELLSCADVDGGLIGGASLKPADFYSIIKDAETLTKS